MSGLSFAPEWHSSSLRKRMVEIDVADDGEGVAVDIDGEDENEPSTCLVVTAAEARMFAAALLHFASEVERR